MRLGLMALGGHNHRAVVAFCRWAAAAGLTVHLAARDRDDPLYRTDYARWVFVQRASAALQLDEVIGWVAQLRRAHGYRHVLLLPSTEFFNRFMLRYRSALEAAGACVPLVDEALYTRLSDKAAFSALCSQHGIAVPAVYPTLPAQAPFVAKPRCYLGSDGRSHKPQLIADAADRAAFLARHRVEDFFFQEWVTGESVYLLAHLARDGRVTAAAQQNLVQQGAGASIVLARADRFHREPAAQPYLQMLQRLGFHGLVMVEVRRQPQRAVMIEANPRLWGPIQFMLDQGVDPFRPWLVEHGLDLPDPVPLGAPRSYYFWSGGLLGQAAPCTYHSYSAARLLDDLPAIAAADLFDRADSAPLHRHELTSAWRAAALL